MPGKHELPDPPVDDKGARMLIFGREPAQILGLVSAVIALLSSTLLDLSIDQQGVLNAVVAAVLGLVTALAVAHEKAAAAISGLMQASLACALAFGFVVSPETQGAVMAFVAAATAFWLRTQVSAPVDMAGNKVQPLPRASDEAVA